MVGIRDKGAIAVALLSLAASLMVVGNAAGQEPQRPETEAPEEATETPPDPASSLRQPLSARDPSVLDRQREVPVFEEQIVVNEVLLDVLVTDRQGNLITGLGIDDFVVIEEGNMIRPDSVTFYGDVESLQAEGSERSDRLFIFFFHHQKSQTSFQISAQNRMARDAHKWLEQELLPNDQVAVLSFDLDLWLHQDFTRDRDKIFEAVDSAARGKKTETSRGRAGYRLDPARKGASDSPSLFANLPRGRDFKMQTHTFQEALELVAKAAAGVIGRKNMLLFSFGFGQMGSATDLHEDSKIYLRMQHALNSGNVAIYGFDVVGIRSGDPKNAAYGSFSKLAQETGGRYFERDTSFIKPMKVVAEETQGYYLIAYRSAYERGTSGYREVQVGTPRGQFYVRGRSGYFFGQPPR